MSEGIFLSDMRALKGRNIQEDLIAEVLPHGCWKGSLKAVTVPIPTSYFSGFHAMWYEGDSTMVPAHPFHKFGSLWAEVSDLK